MASVTDVVLELVGDTGKLFAQFMAVAGGSYLLLYVVFRRRVRDGKIQPRFPAARVVAREIGYSLASIAVFAAVLASISEGPLRPHLRWYKDVGAFGWTYWVFSVVALIVLHDAYFYWTHRFMHARFLRRVHGVHHRVRNPTPFATFSFHPVEAFVLAGFVYPVLLVMPLHPAAFVTFFFVMALYSIYGHLGFELYPKGWSRHWLGQWINTSVGHNLHHSRYHTNFGLYFTWWDRMMGTLDPRYHDTYDEVLSRRG